MTVLVAIIYVGPAMIVEIFAGSFDAIMVALPLNVAELLRWNVPSGWSLPVAWCRLGV
ncbi:hypothetical protein [Tunturiibacter gelidoferens]|uniref:Uncharacterized protein n=1 Tax=Tunturiibacter gelidiferens TaxID=3069689 RepID=A0AAU7YXP9_9BACT|nr:hypothetical protein [Edaphobacter lichenicola]